MRNCFQLFFLPILLVGPAEEASAASPCSNETLTGTYIISASGTDGGNFSAYAGIIAYDGNGNFRIRLRYGGSSQETKEDRGTYTLVGTCEIEAISQSGRSAHYFIDPSGDRFRYVMTSNGVLSGDAQRISLDRLFE